jgi:hypothetical protein
MGMEQLQQKWLQLPLHKRKLVYSLALGRGYYGLLSYLMAITPLAQRGEYKNLTII